MNSLNITIRQYQLTSFSCLCKTETNRCNLSASWYLQQQTQCLVSQSWLKNTHTSLWEINKIKPFHFFPKWYFPVLKHTWVYWKELDWKERIETNKQKKKKSSKQKIWEDRSTYVVKKSQKCSQRDFLMPIHYPLKALVYSG